MTGMALADDGAARHLVPGLAIPGFALQSTRGEPIAPAEADRCVLYIYPWTGRPGHPNPPDWDHIPGAHGSTPEALGFSEHYAAFRALGFDVYGLSGQPSAEQGEFAERMNLPFALLSDNGFAFADALRLPRFSTGGVAYLKRLTLIVRKGAIAAAIYPVQDPGGHAAEVLTLVSRLDQA